MSTTTVNPAIARSVLGFRTYSKYGTYPGGFEEALLTAFIKADSQNRERLAIGFPEYDEALNMSDTELLVILSNFWETLANEEV